MMGGHKGIVTYEDCDYESSLDLRGEKLRLLREHLRCCGQKICPEVNSNSNSEYSEPRMERLGGY
jgi:hypothetical protein